MRVCAIAGGVGSARLCTGLQAVLAPDELTVVVNTADDERIRGLHVSPDVDTVLYHLGRLTDWERGWGVADETYRSNDRYAELTGGLADLGVDLQDWFTLGDLDLATHLLRTRMLDEGLPLSAAVDALRRGLGISSRVLPMSDDTVRTMLTTATGERLDFQTYFVRRGHADEIEGIEYAGADDARPAPGVLDAIGGAEMIVVPPSNPLLSIGPVLAVPGIREALAGAGAEKVAVSPIVGGGVLKGPADRILRSFGHEVSPVGVARLYEGVVDAFVLDAVDADRAPDVEVLSMRAIVCDTIMSGPEEAAGVAKSILDHVLRRAD